MQVHRNTVFKKDSKDMTMTSIKIKFRPSSVEGKEGGIFFQIIHNRVVRQLNTDYRVFASEWDAEAECIIANETRANILCSIKERLAWDTTPRQRHRFTLHRWKLRWLIKPTR